MTWHVEQRTDEKTNGNGNGNGAVEMNGQTIVMMILVLFVLFFITAWLVKSSFNNVMPHLTKSSLKLPKISVFQAFSLLVLMSILLKTNVVVM